MVTFLMRLIIVAIPSLPVMATVTFCEDLTANSLLEVQKFIGSRDFSDYRRDKATEHELDATLLAALETARFNGETRSRLLVAASHLNLVETVRVLAQSIENINWRSSNEEFSMTALFASAWCGNHEVVQVLLEHGASTDAESCLPFGGSHARVCVFPIFAAIAGNRFEGGDPRIVCSIARSDYDGARDWTTARSSTGQTASEVLSLASGRNALLLSSAIRGDCARLHAH